MKIAELAIDFQYLTKPPVTLKTINFHETFTEHFTAEVILLSNLQRRYLSSSAGYTTPAGYNSKIFYSLTGFQLFTNQKAK